MNSKASFLFSKLLTYWQKHVVKFLLLFVLALSLLTFVASQSISHVTHTHLTVLAASSATPPPPPLDPGGGGPW